MSLFVPWVVFPLVLGVLCLGCGLLVERLAGLELPAALLVPLGYAVVVVVGAFTTSNDTTAQLTAPAVIALAVAGLGLGFRWRLRQVLSWPLAAAAAAYAAFGLPVLMSGRATFTGYIQLDDTSTWLAFTDRLLTHGRSLAGLPPSTYQAALDWYWRQNGYPTGAFPPLGVGHVLLRTDSAWLIQPYACFAAGLLALSLYALLRGLVPSRPIRALVAFVASQPALLYGYYLWGGTKEVPTSALLVLLAALTPFAVRERSGVRSVLPLAVASAAMIEILNFGGAVWLVPILLPALVVGLRLHGRAFLWPVAAFAGLAVVLSVPPLVSASGFLRVTKILTKESELGNLIHPLSKLQLFGIWPVGDFRFRPGDIGVTYVLIAVLVGAAAAGVIWAWRSRAWELPLYVTGAVVGCAIAVAAGSPWVDAKALAIASPALVASALVGAAWLYQRGRRIEGAVLAAAIAGGVLWSNALAYHDVWLAPRTQLLELETIGKRFAGGGPTLMTEYQSFGVRHFLRDMDPEAVSELRFRPVFLRSGAYVTKGEYADLDELLFSGVLEYRTFVLLRTPAASRPPSIYDLVWSGRYYDVWQRPAEPATQIIEHLPLGSAADAAGVPSCQEVLRLAALASGRGRLATVLRPPATIVDLSEASYPSTWTTWTGAPGAVYPHGGGTLNAVATVPRAGRYGVFLGGSFRRQLEIRVDGQLVGKARHQLNHPGAYTPMGTIDLEPGLHAIAIDYGDSNLLPGSGGTPFALGPLILKHDDAGAARHLRRSGRRKLALWQEPRLDRGGHGLDETARRPTTP